MRKLTVLDYLEDTVSNYPEKTAVICREESVSYSEFYDDIRKIACSLNKLLGGKTHLPILIFMEKSIPCLEAMYGVAMSGNIYVPMDERTPLERIKKIMQTAGSDIVITGDAEEEKLIKMGYSGELIKFSELIDNEIDKNDDERLAQIRKNIKDTDLLYLLFTSGSTGEPKGVAIRHRSVVDYIDAFIDEVGLTGDDTVGNQTPFYADMSLKDLMILYVGGTLVIIPQQFFMTPKKLLNYLDENKVTTIMWVPTAYRLVSQLNGLSRIKPASLKRFVFSGESMPIPVFEYWLSFYPLSSSTYIQQYGPTEITGACTSHYISERDIERKLLPIGKPFRNTGILLIDEGGNIIATPSPETGASETETGEIFVYGSCLAAGYYNNPAETEKSFVQCPGNDAYPDTAYRTGDLGRYDKDGNIVFISRLDYQVKHGGKRIELGEIESSAENIGALKACCCVHDDENDELIFFYTGEASEKEVKSSLMASLPKYMVPTKYMCLEELPMLPNGKLDRKVMVDIAKKKQN